MENYKFVSKNVIKDITLKTSVHLYDTRPLFSYGYFYRLDYLLKKIREIKTKEKNNPKINVLFKNYDDIILAKGWAQKYKDIGNVAHIHLHLWQVLVFIKDSLQANKMKIMCSHSLIETVSMFRKIYHKKNKDAYNDNSSDVDLFINFDLEPIQVLLFFLQNFNSVFSKHPIIIMKIPYLFYRLDIKVVYIFTIFFENCNILKPRFLESESQHLFLVLSNPKKISRNINSIFKNPGKNTSDDSNSVKNIYMNTNVSNEFKKFILEINTDSQLSDMKELLNILDIVKKNMFFGEKYESFLKRRSQNSATIVSEL